MKRVGWAGTSACVKVLAFCCGLGLVGCTAATPAKRQAADEEAIRKIDADWVKAAQTKQPDAWVAFYADDAVVLPPNDKAATTKADIREAVRDLLGLPELSISWTPTKVEVAGSGDLGYLYGAYDTSWKGADGKLVLDHGKNVEIWKKQANGSWRCIVDTWNSDLPVELPAPTN